MECRHTWQQLLYVAIFDSGGDSRPDIQGGRTTRILLHAGYRSLTFVVQQSGHCGPMVDLQLITPVGILAHNYRNYRVFIADTNLLPIVATISFSQFRFHDQWHICGQV